MIALLTDFGLGDAYVGLLHGVLARRAPEARVVDLSHGVAPGDVREAAYLLASALGYFPDRTLFLCVVDPGVGSERRELALEAGGYRFLAPDNGLLSEVLELGEPDVLVSVERPDLHPPQVSATFHGRDIFAPVAAALETGEAMESLGPRVGDPVALEGLWAREEETEIHARVIHVDRFGNLVTNLRAERLAAWRGGGDIEVGVAGRTIRGLSATYSDVPAGSLLTLIGSGGRLEVSVAQGSALETLNCSPRARVTVRRA